MDEITNNETYMWMTRVFQDQPDYVIDRLLALLTFFGVMGVLIIGRRIVNAIVRRARLSPNIKKLLLDSMASFSLWTFAIIATYVMLQRFSLSDTQETLLRGVTLAVVTAQILWMTNHWIQYAFSANGPILGQTSHLSTIRASLTSATIILVWVLGILLLLDNMSFNVAGILAGLGVGGLAIGLALQSVFKDLIASFTIGFDKPFEVGDFIIVGDLMGTISQVGLKTTRISSLGGEQLVFPNSYLVESNIHNYKRMQERRTVFSFGITYDTDQEILEEVSQVAKEVVESTSNVRFDRAHFKDFGDSSLNFEVVYYVLSPDYNDYMDAQQTINLNLRRQLVSKGVVFAFPTRTLELNEAQLDNFLGILGAGTQAKQRENTVPARH